MPLFSFEVLWPDGSNLVADKRDVPSNVEVWGHLEVLAIQLRRHRDLQLRVKDADGSIVILSGILPIATIERCRRTTCPIKELLAAACELALARHACRYLFPKSPGLTCLIRFRSVRRSRTMRLASGHRPQRGRLGRRPEARRIGPAPKAAIGEDNLTCIRAKLAGTRCSLYSPLPPDPARASDLKRWR